MSLTSEQTSKLLLKDYLNVPYNKPRLEFFDETDPYNNIIIGNAITVQPIPSDPSFVEYQNYTVDLGDEGTVDISASIDTTNVVQKFIRVPLVRVNGNPYAYTAYDTSGNVLLKDAFQFNYEKKGNYNPYNYILYKGPSDDVTDRIDRADPSANWVFNYKSGYIVVYGELPPLNDGNDHYEFTFVKYIGNKGITNLDTIQGNLTVNGTSQFNDTVTVTKGIQNFSDARLKSEVEEIDNALERIDRLRGVKYTMYGDRHVGLIAQDVLRVLPEAVQQHSNGYYTLEYGNMVGLLVEGMKELSRENRALTSRIQMLEEKMGGTREVDGEVDGEEETGKQIAMAVDVVDVENVMENVIEVGGDGENGENGEKQDE